MIQYLSFAITFAQMVSVEQAKQLLKAYTNTPKIGTKSLTDASGFVLAKDVPSPIDMPPFPQSAMDGYALGSGSRLEGSAFKVIGEVAAGSANQFDLKDGEAVRIFTGAPVPESASEVVQQEWIIRDENTITLEKSVTENMHIRPQGEQLKSGDVALKKGILITPASIGFLSMIGITEIEVFQKPKVAVLVTGNELVSPGEQLNHGQVYESNSFMLLAALSKEGIEAKSLRVSDNLEETVTKISTAFEENDMVILSGGISVGDHDHVGTALRQLGVKEVFYKVAQKPGKPLFFGTKGEKAVFALPGNPAASLSCFYEYVLPVMRKFMGRSDQFLTSLKLPISDGNIRSMARAQFLKAKVENGQVSLLEGQSSAMLNTFAFANALVYVPANSGNRKKGDLVELHLLP
ncbi:MAG: molybdopterin molybdotransferase MoeA [Flavobacteriales bacterium]|nr:molybdopterin molybdotransferase MoeA [Flavobacteriales bacterium]